MACAGVHCSESPVLAALHLKRCAPGVAVLHSWALSGRFPRGGSLDSARSSRLPRGPPVRPPHRCSRPGAPSCWSGLGAVGGSYLRSSWDLGAPHRRRLSWFEGAPSRYPARAAAALFVPVAGVLRGAGGLTQHASQAECGGSRAPRCSRCASRKRAGCPRFPPARPRLYVRVAALQASPLLLHYTASLSRVTWHQQCSRSIAETAI